MAVNHLEQLVGEWYEYQGYFVRRNILVGKRDRGGYECELDVVAFHPVKMHLVHIEPSLDADSWAKREERFQKKFQAGKKYIPALFRGLKLPNDIEQIAVLVFANKKNHQTLAGARLMLVDELMSEVFTHLKSKRIAISMIPEQFTILRSFQFVTEYRDVVMEVWK